MGLVRANSGSGGGAVTSISLLKQYSSGVAGSTEDTTIDLSKCYLVVSYVLNSSAISTYTDQAYIVYGSLTIVYGTNPDMEYTLPNATTLRCKHLTGQRTSNVRIYEIS